MKNTYLHPTQESGRDFIKRNIQGKIVMLNLLQFREIADYSATPELIPEQPVTGEEAYRWYMDLTLPFLEESGGRILFYGKGGEFLVGPTDERWDAVLIIEQNSVQDFIAFNSNQEYQKILGHRTAAVLDSRLLPIIQE